MNALVYRENIKCKIYGKIGHSMKFYGLMSAEYAKRKEI